MTWREKLRDAVVALELKPLTPGQLADFEQLLALLLKYNKEMNLTTIVDAEEVAFKHILDSLTVELVWRAQEGQHVIDIGTGAGFPGLPLAIRHPELQFAINDATKKKIDYLAEVIRALSLENATELWGRAEELGRGEWRNKFHVVTARALAHLGTLAEYALPLLKMDGFLVAMKGPGGIEEVRDAAPALTFLGGKVHDIKHIDLPGVGERLLIVVKKVRPTPGGYPRNAGQMKRKPLFEDNRAGRG